MSFTSTFSEEKENGEAPYPRNKALSPEMRYAGSSASSGRGSPARGFRGVPGREDGSETSSGIARERPTSSLPQPTGGNGQESWKRAAEVTSQLKARIEQMKVSSSLGSVSDHMMTDLSFRLNKDLLDLEASVLSELGTILRISVRRCICIARWRHDVGL